MEITRPPAKPGEPKPKISVLISARRNSKYLAKFMFGLYERTSDYTNVDIHIMLNEHDTWNRELIDFFSQPGGGPDINFYRENLQLGRAGLHEYFNLMVPHARGEWLIYFCEDHFIVMDNWDEYVRNVIAQLQLDPRKVWCLIPKFDNVGAMNQILSRGYVEALGGKLGRHGWIDSYVNDLNVAIPDRVVRFDHEMFHDFTHDKPNPMSEAHVQSISTEKGKHLPEYKSNINRRRIEVDQEQLLKAIEKEGKNGLQG